MLKKIWWAATLAFSLALSAIILSKPATATTLGIHTLSYHSSGNYNNTNPGVYLEHNGYTVGTYYNSERHQTYYVGYTFGGNLWSRVDWGLSVGAATGYERSAVVPMVVPSIRVRLYDGFGVRLSAVPPVAGSPAVAHLSLEYRF